MLHHYRDIRDRIPTPPLWWDEAGVPRYCEFGHDETNDIYAHEVALVEIACQNCGRRFLVGFGSSLWPGRKSLSEQIESDSIHYGDPPNVGCCPAGPTMNCRDLRVVQFWRKDGGDWVRVPELERDLPQRW